MEKKRILIGLGSNIDPVNNIASAIKLLSRELTLLRVSPFYRSKPVGFTEQNDFVNGCILLLSDTGTVKYFL